MKQNMNMKDRHSKGDAREMQGRWQALGCFMEQLRSSLGAGYSMARVWVEYGYSMGRVCLSVSQSEVSELPVRSKRTVGPKEADSQSVGGVLRALRCAVCVMMVMMGVNLWGQTPTTITSLGDIEEGGDYIITSDIDASSFSTSIASFSGSLTSQAKTDGTFPVITGLTVPLFTTATNATISNIILDNVGISQSGKVGSIACTANGATRIYNCGILSGSVGSTGTSTGDNSNDCCGGLVGFLDETARVINCYSYATITGGNRVGGIVGYNNFQTTSATDNLKTMVMNCMFYGDITGGQKKAPIYHGKKITNAGSTAVGNYNYFSAEANYVKNNEIDMYYCALMAETRFLQRFEFYRYLLNSHRELAAWWATGDRANKDLMAKWVLEPSQIGSEHPYPILKAPNKQYPSVVNIDAKNATTQSERNKGGKLGTLTVNIQMGNGAQFEHPNGATITTSQLTLNITDKDYDHFNYNYYKVQLPYYNDVGTNNYTGGRVVTGWKIVSITGGEPGTFTTGSYDATTDANGNITVAPYNFADRYCTNKDLYGTGGSNRVFSQGAYWDVPEGVTAITIEPYWAKAVYVADANADVVYSTDMKTAYQVPNVGGGQIYTNGVSTFNGDDQKVYTNTLKDNGTIDKTAIANALTALSPAGSHTVNDYAVVLVGNYHQYNSIEGGNRPYTVTSVDLDNDNEPDYSFILRFDGRTKFHPVKYDFLNLVGLGMAQKSTGSKGSYNFGIPQPIYWFEVTNTALFRVTQMEYSRNEGASKRPIILQGGVIEQWVSLQTNPGDRVQYIHLGGNVWFKEFHRGSHQDNANITTPHPPLSVTGGDFDKFYLTGAYQPQAGNANDDAECYINGGRFGIVAGAGMEGIGHATNHTKGNIIWQIDNADIEEFYGGGINGEKPIQGNITTVIRNSYVGLFCGGPKFGDMNSGRTVKTKATNCHFGTYFGAGYGGNSYYRAAPGNFSDATDPWKTGDDKQYNLEWNKWVKGEIKGKKINDGNYSPQIEYNGYHQDYISNFGGVSVGIDYQFIPMSNNTSNVARLFVDFVSFSLATTRNVTSNLTGCTITNNFYGGGSLGAVEGPVTSTLTDCTVDGSVFGAGYSASLPTVSVMNTTGFKVEPYYNKETGVFMPGTLPDYEPTVYRWEHAETVNSTETAINNKGDHILYTEKDLTALGVVTGDVTLNIAGTTTVGKSVYGGGEESNVKGKTLVNMSGGTVYGNVFGGGKGTGEKSFTCEKAMVGTEETSNACENPGSDANKDKGTIVTISNGTVGTLEGTGESQTLKKGTGNVYGGGEVGRVEWNTQVKIGIGTGEGPFAPVIYGSVFGAGKGLETHGYSALVRGNSTVTVQGNAKIGYNVYGGGEKSTVGRYWVKDIPSDPCSGETKPDAPSDLPTGMPYQQRNGGICRVTIQGNAEIGFNGAADDKGHVFGAGKGVNPLFVPSGEEGASQKMTNSNDLVDFEDDPANNKTAKELYLEFLQTLALVTNSYVTIDGSAHVNGSVFGGSENGFVQTNTNVTIQGDCEIGTTTYGNVFGGGKGLEDFAEAGKVKGNTTVAISDGTINGNVYGGGSLGDVGKIDKSDPNYNYVWKKSDGITANTLGNNTITDTNDNTGICTVRISGGTIGVANADKPEEHGNVFGAGRGSDKTWWCEKAIAYATNVSITDGTVYGTVYGGGEVGRVEDDAKVVIGTSEETGTGKPNITGSVFGGGAGLATHGYSALVRGNSEVTVQGAAKVGVNVYGGGEIASVGRFKVEGGLPTKPKGGGTCIVTVKDNAVIGTDGVDGTGNVFGSCKGVTPVYVASGDDRSKSMQLEANIPKEIDPETGEVIIDPTTNKPVVKEQGTYWDYYETYPDNYEGPKFVWVYYTTEDEYLAFLPTLGLASNTYVTIGGSTTVNGSVYGGGQRGVTLGGVDVNINGGIVNQDVYGGGALANTNSSHWHNGERTKYVTLTELLNGSPVKGYYTKSGDTYTLITNETLADEAATYYAIFKTNVNLTGGTVNRNVYGGGLGQLAKDAVAAKPAQGTEGEDGYVPAVSAQDEVPAIEAKVYGDVFVTLNKPTISGQTTTYGDCKVKGNIFGCNNLNGSPQSAVTVHVYKTQGWDGHLGTLSENLDSENNSDHNYHVEAVYGGGNLAAYMPDMNAIADTAQTHVIIDGCGETSIRQVYGGGNAASTPATNVTINGTYEIEEVFGGGNGLDDIIVNGETKPNPGANVGFKDYSEVEDTYDTKEKRQDEGVEGGFVENYVYGSGKASVTIYGGKIHRVFGGSNTKGNVRQTAVTMLQDLEGCDFCVDEAYGGGKSAPMDAEAQLLMACIPGLKAAYGGAQDADIQDNVVLTITNGTFDRVFGGNNVNGKIQGTITVNIEETGCKPLIIGQLYGGGNQAPYTAPSGEHGPTLNVKSFTSIGDIYGGGYGETAVVEGDTYVNINVSEGKYAKDAYTQTTKTITFNEYQRNKDGEGEDSFVHDNDGKRVVEEKSISVILPGHDANKMGAIYNVFGGGNAAKVKGNTHVNIGSQTGDDVVFETPLTKVVQGVESATTSEERTHTVLGADIRGNIYGGGNNAEVTGDTNVQIGKKVETSTTPEADPTPGP